MRTTGPLDASGLKTGCRSYVCCATSIFSCCLSWRSSPVSLLYLLLPTFLPSLSAFNTPYVPSSFTFSLSNAPRTKETVYIGADEYKGLFSSSLALQGVSQGDSCRITKLMVRLNPARESFVGKNGLSGNGLSYINPS